MKRLFSYAALRAVVAMGIGLALCAGLVFHLDRQGALWRELWAGISWPWCAVTLFLTYLLWWTGAKKWGVWSEALHGESGREPYPHFFFTHFAWQNWVGQFVPPSLAIVMGRSWASRDMKGVGWKAGAGSAVYDQLLEFVILAAFLPAAYVILIEKASWLLVGTATLAGLAAVGLLLLLFRSKLSSELRERWGSICWLSFVRVVLTVVRLVAGAPALGLLIDPLWIAAAAPVVAILALIPLTPGNLGIAEWGWVGVLAFAGTEPVTAGMLALGFRLLVFVCQTLLLGLLVRRKTA